MNKSEKISKEDIILDTALQLFNDTCFGRVGVDLIIQKSNVAKMTFYKKFDSKENLIKRCLIKQDFEVRNQISARMKGKKRNGLKAVLDYYENWFNSSDFGGSLFVKAVNEFPDDDEIKNIARHHREFLKDIIVQSLDNDDKFALAKHIMILLDGAIVHRRIYQSDSLEIVKDFVRHKNLDC